MKKAGFMPHLSIAQHAISLQRPFRYVPPLPGLSRIFLMSYYAIIHLRYGERPQQRGLHFMDSWMSSSVLFLGFAAAGSVLNIFQVGGSKFCRDCMMPVFNAGVVAPVMFMTGNPRTWENAGGDMDFCASTVLSQNESIPSAGQRLLTHLCSIATGELTKGETFALDETVEVYLRGQCF